MNLLSVHRVQRNETLPVLWTICTDGKLEPEGGWGWGVGGYVCVIQSMFWMPERVEGVSHYFVVGVYFYKH